MKSLYLGERPRGYNRLSVRTAAARFKQNREWGKVDARIYNAAVVAPRQRLQLIQAIAQRLAK